MKVWTVTVNDILKRDIFKHAKLIAGENGKHREIKWTHILEMDEFDEFINGGELILTTGSNIAFDSPAGIPKIKRLIEKNVAGICIELGTHVKEINPEIIQTADQHHFPIITFPHIVKFVDITQDLHTIIINQHHQMLKQLHHLSNQFNELSLEPNGVLKIIKKLHEHFHTTVLLITDDKKTYYSPLQNNERLETIRSFMNKSMNIEAYKDFLLDNEYYTAFPIKGLGHSWGNLCLQEKSENLDEFSFSVLDRASLAIAQILLRNRTIEERKQNQEEEIVQKLLHGEEYESSIAHKILPAPAKNLYYRLILVENHTHEEYFNKDDWEEIKLQQSIIIRSLFKKYGFFPAMSVTKNKIAVIASFYKNSNAQKDTDRFILVSKEINHIYEKNIFHGNECNIGISSFQKDYANVASCYKEANNVLFIQKKQILKALFYEEIGVYRLLSKLSQEELESYAAEYLGPLLEYDEKMNGNLLLTLSVFLETMGSKKETADRLFIVRQTLYHRLDKIKELLGEDFMEPMKRQAIEMATCAYALLNNNSNFSEFTKQ
ncbi:PucR family transcriptional regulator [Oceanobacillus piezotolerans]|uniref:PucR family transcriptional regulator n=1 Tax=Oceanobacillus piezotolerans TaxID=2448030 RepID=A0A498DLF4_9BACI|nr:PucR family transcriptional regulator [Oceanobacillus piezotolerans]RLL43809.1 PucR family transcriptional regulator [Oceanobacillus piezotolerans]